MGRDTLSQVLYSNVRDSVTRGGTVSATRAAEERIEKGLGLDPLVDPKGLPHLGPVRMSLPRFEQKGDLWELTRGLPMGEETLLDTTGSMGGNVALAFQALPQSYAMLTEGSSPILGRYDPQIATGIFNDVEDPPSIAVLARSQFEMAEKIAQQMAMLPPGRNGCGNNKEDPQYGLFAAAFLTAATINRWGLKYYHFTISDEWIPNRLSLRWVKKLFGDDALEVVRDSVKFWEDYGENVPPHLLQSCDFTDGELPDSGEVIKHLQQRAHAFFLQVPHYSGVYESWERFYGEDHVVVLPGSTENVHFVKAVIVGLTEGVLDLSSASDFLEEHGLNQSAADQIVRAVSHIPLAAQTTADNFDKLPKAGDLFASKTDPWPIDPNTIDLAAAANQGDDAGPGWL